MSGWFEFDVHGAAAIRVARAAPTSAQLEEMLAPFLTQGLLRHDLVVTADPEPMAEAARAEDEYEYTDTALLMKATHVQIALADGGVRISGRRELLTSLLPLLDRILVGRGVAMIHAATVAYRGRGVCLPAWGGAGKTSTVAKLLRIDGVGFMGDDWAFLREDATLLGYAKPMFIKPHHRPIYPHLFAGAHKPLVPSALSRPLGRLTTLVHPLVTQFPRFARVTRRWSPEHMAVTPARAFPSVRISTSTPLRVAIFVERFDGSRTQMVDRETEWMVSRLVGNFHAELSRHSREVITALGATGLVPIDRTFADKAEVLRRALRGVPAFLLRVPASLSPDRASDVVVAQVREALQDTDVTLADSPEGVRA